MVDRFIGHTEDQRRRPQTSTDGRRLAAHGRALVASAHIAIARAREALAQSQKVLHGTPSKPDTDQSTD